MKTAVRALVRALLRRLFGRAHGAGPGAGVERQFGAIPYRHGAAGSEFLLITSRRTGRWIFPKGGRIAWLSAPACASQEAYEEAGVEGEVAPEPLGSYRGTKLRAEGDSDIEVEMYALEVELELADWPERGQRRRRWAGLEEAAALISEPGLVVLLRRLAARLAESPKEAPKDAAG